MLAARHKLSRKLCANLVEAVVEAHSRPNQEASFRNALLRGARLSKLHANQQKRLRAVALKLPARFWSAAAWACANDVQGSQPKHASQRRSRNRCSRCRICGRGREHYIRDHKYRGAIFLEMPL